MIDSRADGCDAILRRASLPQKLKAANIRDAVLAHDAIPQSLTCWTDFCAGEIDEVVGSTKVSEGLSVVFVMSFFSRIFRHKILRPMGP